MVRETRVPRTRWAPGSANWHAAALGGSEVASNSSTRVAAIPWSRCVYAVPRSTSRLRGSTSSEVMGCGGGRGCGSQMMVSGYPGFEKSAGVNSWSGDKGQQVPRGVEALVTEEW